MKSYTEYMDNISVDAELHDKIIKRITQKPSPIKRNRAILRYSGLAACALILIVCIWMVPVLFNNNSTIPPIFDKSIVGLPVENFNLADIDNHTMADRRAFNKLTDFFSYHSPDMFAFVRVIDTELKDEKNRDHRTLQQTSSLQILSVVWNRKIDIPEIISTTQYLFGGCCGDEITNLLRNGGVYLLPLIQHQDKWYIMSDLDVLFEVDDKGRIWSHSPFEGLNRFDGEYANILAESITALTLDINFPAAITTFGNYSRDWGVLAETTVLSVTPTKDKWDNDCYHYILTVDSILSTTEKHPWQPVSDEILAISFGPYSIIEQGEKYLMILDIYEDEVHLEQGRIAKINEDGTINAIHSIPYENNIFFEFNGFTVEQMKTEAERAKAWHAAYVK
jgi:hypothetical protein